MTDDNSLGVDETVKQNKAVKLDSLNDGEYTSLIVKHNKHLSSQNDDSQVALRRKDLPDSCFEFAGDDVCFKKWLIGLISQGLMQPFSFRL